MPGGLGDTLPQGHRRDRARHLAGGSFGQAPLAVGLDCPQEIVAYPYRVVGVLPGNGGVSLGVPVGVEDWKFDMTIALAGELDDALDVVLGQFRAPRRDDLPAQR